MNFNVTNVPEENRKIYASLVTKDYGEIENSHYDDEIERYVIEFKHAIIHMHPEAGCIGLHRKEDISIAESNRFSDMSFRYLVGLSYLLEHGLKAM